MTDQALPRSRWRRLIGMGAISLFMLVALIALGVWQIHRWHYKDRIQREIHAAQLRPPVPLSAKPSPYEKVALTGTWVAGKAAFYGDQIRNSPTGPLRGGQLIVPFRRADGGVVLVDLGWVRGRAPKTVPLPAGPAVVSGYVQAPQKFAPFAPSPDLARLVFYKLDPRAIGAALGFADAAPFTLVMIGPKPVAGGPIPAPSLPTPPNNSEQYALTWFGLAFVVVLEYIFYIRKVLLETA